MKTKAWLLCLLLSLMLCACNGDGQATGDGQQGTSDADTTAGEEQIATDTDTTIEGVEVTSDALDTDESVTPEVTDGTSGSEEAEPPAEPVDDGLTYTLNTDGQSYSVTDCRPDLTVAIIADTYMGLPVTKIGADVFKDVQLTSVTIPEGITTIGAYSFHRSPLTNIKLPESLTFIGENAFSLCYDLTSINIPDAVTHIGNDAFYNCTKLFETHDGIAYVDGWAVQYTVSADPDSWELTLQEGTVGIGERVLEFVFGMEYAVIPDSVKYICKSAFSSCEDLNTVYYGGTAAEWEQISIAYSEEPDEYTSDALTSATVYYYSVERPVDGNNAWYYDDDGVPTRWD
ncbi:MAG: leucine-rich repeat domain-containing protein [Clostridia bacterium]|nr:leucine-rich repeat domain-containing protein [Clostridia bacterium]